MFTWLCQDDQTLVAKLDDERSFALGEFCSLGIRPEYYCGFDQHDKRIAA